MLARLGEWRWPALIVTALVIINGWWLHAHRRWGLLELDEADYVTIAVGIGRQGSLSGFGGAIGEGFAGPMQGLLVAPAQWVTGASAMTLFWQSTVLLAFTAIVCFAAVRYLAGVSAGVVSALVVVGADRMLDYSRSALTVLPAAAFSAAAMAGLVASRGLRRTGWAIAFGAGAGAMIISRSMTIAFLPALAIAAGCWAYSLRTPRAIAVRNAALAAFAALIVAGWWWVARGPEVMEYLTGPGLDNAAMVDGPLAPVLMVPIQAVALFRLVGAVATVMVLSWVVLRFRDRHPGRSPEPAAPGTARSIPLWPLWIGVGLGLVALAPSSAVGTGFSAPLVPWLVIAMVAGARRTLSDRRWPYWAGAAAVASVASLGYSTLQGVEANWAWCRPAKAWTCSVEGPESAEWQTSIDATADRVRRRQLSGRSADGPSQIVYASRDWLVNGNSIASSGRLRREWSAAWTTSEQAAGWDRAALRSTVERSHIVVIVPDRPPVNLRQSAPEPSLVETVAIRSGFTRCGEVMLPDDRVVEVLARQPAPPDACR